MSATNRKLSDNTWIQIDDFWVTSGTSTIWKLSATKNTNRQKHFLQFDGKQLNSESKLGKHPKTFKSGRTEEQNPIQIRENSKKV
jgi:hypothetical protein